MNVATEPESGHHRLVPRQYSEATPAQLEISSRLTDRVELETRGPSGRLRDLSAPRRRDSRFQRRPGERERTFTITRYH